MTATHKTGLPDGSSISRRELLRRGTLSALGLASAASINGILDVSQASAAGVSAGRGSLSRLIAGAKQEGQVTTVGLDPSWVNYGEIIDTFHRKYGVTLTDSAPTAVGAQIVQAVASLEGQDREADVVELSFTYTAQAIRQRLVIPYRVATWDSVPRNMKDPHGYWVGSYWGATSFLAVRGMVKNAPKDWHDLRLPEYKGMVAISGDPRLAGQAFAAVMAASLANGGSLNNIQPGIDFFAELKRSGNFVPAPASSGNIAKGATPIAVKWDFLNLATRDSLANQGGATITIPKSGVVGAYYCESVTAFARHPHAARLWQEFLLSDQGQLLVLKGYAHPARYENLVSRHKVPGSLTTLLPHAQAYKHVKFPSLHQISMASAVLQEQWGPKVAGS